MVAETAVIAVRSQLPPLSPVERIALESLVPALLVGPVLYRLLLVPLASSVAESFGRLVGDADRLAIVDAHGTQARSSPPESGVVEHASSPSDLTGISIGVTECLNALERQSVTDLRLSFRSVSTLLSYLDAESVFRFLHVFTAHVERAGVLGVFTLNESAHHDRTIGMIKAVFDGILQVR